MLMDAQSTYAGSFPGQPRRLNGADPSYDSQGLASLITEKLNGYDGYPYGYLSSSSVIPESTTLPPSQSLPTSVLYERARQAAVAKSSAHARREGLQSTRRPWTPEEEKALMAGLDMVKGPHWSQILQLFGLNGTISDILKDRTQVQLKDKARNLKLFFLKTNSEMPYYLQCVTGELKTRAPSQAARKEAEEQARVQAGSSPGTYASTYMNGNTVNGTGTLAHGLPLSGSPRPGSTTPGAGPSTPVAASHAHYPPQPSYQQHRPQQLQPASNGAASSQARSLQPQSQHQPIAPAPSYQRTLQQAGTPTISQYQQRPAQQPAVQTSANYQQTQPQIQRPAAAPTGLSVPPRTGPGSTSMAPTQPRPLGALSQPPPAAPRPALSSSTAPPRPSSIPPSVSTAPPATASAPKSVPTVMSAPRSQTPANPTPAPAKPVPQAPVPGQASTAGSQPAAQVGVARQPQSAPAPSVAASASVSGPPAKSVSHATAPALTNFPTPAQALAPTPAPAPAPVGHAAPNIQANTTESAESKEKAADELLAKTLKAALDSA